MIYYVYFDHYGDVRGVISRNELENKYNSDPDEFLKAMSKDQVSGDPERVTGHVGTMRFETEEELDDYLKSLGEEVDGFFCCRSDSRPYNF